MSRSNRVLSFGLVACFSLQGAIAPAFAEEDPFGFTDEDPFAFSDEEEQEAAAPPLNNFIRINLGAVSADNHQFSHFADYTDEGGFISADLGWLRPTENSQLKIDVMDLGLHTQRFDLSFKEKSLLRATVSYKEIPLNKNNTGVTPFSGTGYLALPENWQTGVNVSDFSLSQFGFTSENDSLRKTLSASLSKRLQNGFSVSADVSVENRQGTQLKGMAIYSNAANPQAVILPTPIDEDATKLNLTAGFSSSGLSLETAVNFTRFDNQYDVITWENPYASGLGAVVDFPLGVGGFAAAPDYDTVALSFTGAYKLSPNMRLTVDGMTSETEQQSRLPEYTVNSSLLLAQPVGSVTLGDALESDMLNLMFSARPMKRTSLNLKYRFTGRKSNLPDQPWYGVIGDSSDQDSSTFWVDSDALDFEKDLYEFEGVYRLKNRTRIGLEWQYEETFRNHAAVTNTEEDTLTLKIQQPTSGNITNKFELSRSELLGSTYEWSKSFFEQVSPVIISQIPDDQRWTNHPLLRQFHVADQDEVSYKFSSTWVPNEKWSVQGTASGQEVSFDRSDLGLTNVTQGNLNLSASYTPSDSLSAFAWLDVTHDEREQTGRDFNGGLNKPANRVASPLPEGSDAMRNYDVDQETLSKSLGVGVEWQINQRASFTSAYSQVMADESFEVLTYGARDLVGDDLPDIKHRLYQLESQLEYVLENGMLVNLVHQYYRYSTDDWAYRGVAIGDINKVLNTGQSNPNETVNLISLGVSYRF